MNDSFVGSATDALWWAGWRPAKTAGVFAAVGIFVAGTVGWFGVGTLAFGVAVVALGAVLTSVRRAVFVAAVAAVGVFFVVGAEIVEETFESLGVGTVQPTEAFSEAVLEVAALAGIEPAGEPTEVVGSAVAWLSLSSLAGAAVGGVVWFACIQYVNRTHDGVRDELVARVREAGKEVLRDETEGDEDSIHTLVHGEGGVPLVEPSEKYDVANLSVGESSASIHHGSVVRMRTREAEIGEGTEEVYYDQISSVGYDGRRLRIRTADGEAVNVVTSGKPTDAVDEIDERLREYKERERKQVESRELKSHKRRTTDSDVPVSGGDSHGGTVAREGEMEEGDAEEAHFTDRDGEDADFTDRDDENYADGEDSDGDTEGTDNEETEEGQEIFENADDAEEILEGGSFDVEEEKREKEEDDSRDDQPN